MKQSPRPIKFSTIWNLIKQKPLSALAGGLLTIFPLMIILPLALIFSLETEHSEDLDYETIRTQGTRTEGVITDIITNYNVSVNGHHPSIIHYQYEVQGVERHSEYEVLAPEKIAQLAIGDRANIRYRNNRSVIEGLVPYRFPFHFLFFIPLPFFLIGLIFSLPMLVRVRKQVILYKYGKLMQAKLLSMLPKSGILSGNGLLVHYQYQTQAGQTIVSYSITKDFSLLNEKKQGAMVDILVAPNDESKSCLFPKLEAIENGWEVESVMA